MSERSTADLAATLHSVADIADIRMMERYPNGNPQHNILREAGDRLGELEAKNERLRVAVLDIDAHATPMGLAREDDPEGNPDHYHLTVGALHRALGVIGHTAPKGITSVDLESDFITMLYDLVPEAIGIPIGASALIWRAARELEAIANRLPPCPTCDGKGTETFQSGSSLSADDPVIYRRRCPDCIDGKVPLETVIAYWIARHQPPKRYKIPPSPPDLDDGV